MSDSKAANALAHARKNKELRERVDAGILPHHPVGPRHFESLAETLKEHAAVSDLVAGTNTEETTDMSSKYENEKRPEFAAQAEARGDSLTMDFGSALAALKGGWPVARLGWNGKGQYLRLQRPDSGSYMTLPYIFISTVLEQRVPWLASQTDLLSNDWVIDEEAMRIEA